jgi:pimeloyl-ACP methyl ester carboxylesterase
VPTAAALVARHHERKRVRKLRMTALSALVVGALAGSALASASFAAAADPAEAGLPPVTAAAPAPAVQAAEAVAQVSWKACADADLHKAEAKCGTLSVPLDYSRPGGAQIQLALSRVEHTVPQAQYQGIMLVNPGGPGGSGVGLSILGGFVPNHAGAAYDWIGFDPRGVGASDPALTCQKHYFGPTRPEYVPTTAALEKSWLDRAKAYARACGVNGGELLAYLKTTDTVRDMDRIRASLGARQLNFYGFSYGTYLGQVYSTMFPDRVRRMVLDSNVDPTRVWYQANLDQDVAFERNEKLWWAWIASYDATYHLGSTEKAVEKAWYAEAARLRRSPAGGRIGPAEWNDIFLTAGYAQVTWPDQAALWADWVKTHKPAAMIAEYERVATPDDDNGYAIYDAVQCTDTAWPSRWSTWREDNWQVYQKARFETWGNAWFNAPCLNWPASSGRPVDVDGRKTAPILLVGETLDAATPFSGSLEVRKRFPMSRLIALPGGTSHAFSLFGNACLDDQIAAYLADGTLPPRKPGSGPDTTCDPLPAPVPGTLTAPVGAALKAATSDRYALLTRLLHSHRL